MSDDAVIRHCAPTLAGIKTGNLFSCECYDRESLIDDVRSINKSLVPKGLCMVPLRFFKNRVLLYLYRPEYLRKDLSRKEAVKLLDRFGYRIISCGHALRTLSGRLGENGEFPHEIGLFLSYPPEDVLGFIENGASNYKLLGYWKVYGDEKKAKKIFDRYKKCTDQYCRLWNEGRDLQSLAVSA